MIAEKLKNNDEVEEGLKTIVDDYVSQKQARLLALKKGNITRAEFLKEAEEHIKKYIPLKEEARRELLDRFEEYVFGYSRLSVLIDDPDISDIRVVSHDCIRVKKKGRRMQCDIAFRDEREYRQFVDYVAMKNQANISNLNAIQRFTDSDSHPDFILRFTISMPLVNAYTEPYLCIRKVPKKFPLVGELVNEGMMGREVA